MAGPKRQLSGERWDIETEIRGILGVCFYKIFARRWCKCSVVATSGPWGSPATARRHLREVKLIAAAPELLELAESVAAAGEQWVDEELAELGARACELIAKVESRKLPADS